MKKNDQFANYRKHSSREFVLFERREYLRVLKELERLCAEKAMRPMALRVRLELRRYVKESGVVAWRFYFNNFIQRLPGAGLRAMMERHALLWLDRPDPKARADAEELLRLSRDVDLAVAETGVDMAELWSRVESRRREGLPADLLLSIPVFVRLRQKGYRRYPDLTA